MGNNRENNESITQIDDRGFILTSIVDIEFLRSIQPRQHVDFIKFVVDIQKQLVAVGMHTHAHCELNDDHTSEQFLYGGNIYFKDGKIVYSSTLNVAKNIKGNRKWQENPRIIIDQDLIDIINDVLFKWVKL